MRHWLAHNHRSRAPTQTETERQWRGLWSLTRADSKLVREKGTGLRATVISLRQHPIQIWPPWIGLDHHPGTRKQNGWLAGSLPSPCVRLLPYFSWKRFSDHFLVLPSWKSWPKIITFLPSFFQVRVIEMHLKMHDNGIGNPAKPSRTQTTRVPDSLPSFLSQSMDR